MPHRKGHRDFSKTSIPGSDFATDIVFPGTEGRLGLPPKKIKQFDNRRKAKKILLNFNEELL